MVGYDNGMCTLMFVNSPNWIHSGNNELGLMSFISYSYARVLLHLMLLGVWMVLTNLRFIFCLWKGMKPNSFLK